MILCNPAQKSKINCHYEAIYIILKEKLNQEPNYKFSVKNAVKPGM